MGTVGGESVSEVMLLDGATANELTEFVVDLPGEGQHFVYLEILEVDANRMAWTAPIWIAKR